MTTTPADDDTKPCDFVYAGRRKLANNKPGIEIHTVIDGKLGRRMHFTAKGFKKGIIGGVYRGAEFSENRVRGLDNAQFYKHWDDKEASIDWLARDGAYEAQQRQVKLEADARKVHEIEAIMLPLRKQYAAYTRQYDHGGKEALEQAVLRALRSPPRKTENE